MSGSKRAGRAGVVCPGSGSERAHRREVWDRLRSNRNRFVPSEIRCRLGRKGAQSRLSDGSCLNHGYSVRHLFTVGKGCMPCIRRLLYLPGGTILLAPHIVKGESVPDALSVEWQGQKPCEKLFEDAQVRIARCTFPPGSVHLRHSHPGYLSYVLSGGKGQLQDDKGTRQVEVRADTFTNSQPIAWHELTNIGETTLRYLVVERKYEPAPVLEQTAGNLK
jgi:quercetin dioxygenase-like cupin family protein